MRDNLELPQLESSDINIFFIQEDDISDQYMEECKKWLSDDEIIRYTNYYFEKDRREYLLGKILTRFVLSFYTEIPAEKLIFKKNDFGKPVLKNASNIAFNLSHCSGVNVLAVSMAGSVGIDLERLNRKHASLSLINSFCSPTELSDFSGVDDKNRVNRFFLLWTLKESFVKSLGKGLSFPLADVTFDLNEETNNMSLSRSIDNGLKFWDSETIFFCDDYLCTSMLLSSNVVMPDKKYYRIIENENCCLFVPQVYHKGVGKIEIHS